jgi:hypothetical protein
MRHTFINAINGLVGTAHSAVTRTMRGRNDGMVLPTSDADLRAASTLDACRLPMTLSAEHRGPPQISEDIKEASQVNISTDNFLDYAVFFVLNRPGAVAPHIGQNYAPHLTFEQYAPRYRVISARGRGDSPAKTKMVLWPRELENFCAMSAEVWCAIAEKLYAVASKLRFSQISDDVWTAMETSKRVDILCEYAMRRYHQCGTQMVRGAPVRIQMRVEAAMDDGATFVSKRSAFDVYSEHDASDALTSREGARCFYDSNDIVVLVCAEMASAEKNFRDECVAELVLPARTQSDHVKVDDAATRRVLLGADEYAAQGFLRFVPERDPCAGFEAVSYHENFVIERCARSPLIDPLAMNFEAVDRSVIDALARHVIYRHLVVDNFSERYAEPDSPHPSGDMLRVGHMAPLASWIRTLGELRSDAARRHERTEGVNVDDADHEAYHRMCAFMGSGAIQSLGYSSFESLRAQLVLRSVDGTGETNLVVSRTAYQCCLTLLAFERRRIMRFAHVMRVGEIGAQFWRTSHTSAQATTSPEAAGVGTYVSDDGAVRYQFVDPVHHEEARAEFVARNACRWYFSNAKSRSPSTAAEPMRVALAFNVYGVFVRNAIDEPEKTQFERELERPTR